MSVFFIYYRLLWDTPRPSERRLDLFSVLSQCMGSGKQSPCLEVGPPEWSPSDMPPPWLAEAAGIASSWLPAAARQTSLIKDVAPNRRQKLSRERGKAVQVFLNLHWACVGSLALYEGTVAAAQEEEVVEATAVSSPSPQEDQMRHK